MTQSVPDFATPVSEEMLQRVAEKIRARNIETLIVNDGAEARQVVLERLPNGAQVHSGKSKTLQDAGILDAIMDPNHYDALRHHYFKLDRKTQAHEIRRLVAAPDYMLGSLNAVTEDGILVATSATSGQIGPYANTAGKVIFVVGSQKIVPDVQTALKRVHDYVLPWEDEQVIKASNGSIHSFVGKTLLIEREWVNERMTVILVRTPIGI